VTGGPRTRWGTRAAELYTAAYADAYRAYDDGPGAGPAVASLSNWLRTISEQFAAPIDVLDLGCGTGRYFHAATNVRRLTGIDVSRPMLERARLASARRAGGEVTLVEGDFLTCEFPPATFDLVYAIGVLAEHSPLDQVLVSRVKRWLRPEGRFAFTAVHPCSPSVPRTRRRRAGERLLALAEHVPVRFRRMLRARLMSSGLYADPEHVREVVEAAGLQVESIAPFQSDVHLHVLAVARKSQLSTPSLEPRDLRSALRFER
jgi:SAM-dependent methyltransferase